MTQAQFNSISLFVGVIGLFVTIVGGYNKLMHEIKTFKKAMGDEVERDRKIDHILEHDEDIDNICLLLERMEKTDRKLERDYKRISEHDNLIAKNAQHIADDRTITDKQQEAIRLILESLLAIMLALEAQGINHKTSKSMEDLREYLIKR